MKRLDASILFPLIFFFACNNRHDDPINRVPFENEVIADFRVKFCEINKLLNELEYENKMQFGFIIVNDSLLFRHCLNEKGYYLDSLGCALIGKNINSLFTRDQKKEFLILANYFKEKGIAGTTYSESLESYILFLDLKQPTFDVTDGRYLYCNCTSANKEIRKPDYHVIDFREGIFLLSINP